MNENSRYRNPESVRIENLRKEQERLSYEARQRAEEPTPQELKERQRAHKAETLRRLLAKSYSDKPKEWREARLRRLLGLPEPVKRTAPAPIRTKTPAIYGAINQRIARSFGLEIGQNSPITYR